MKTKTEMLRVRLTLEERNAMEALIQRRGKGETISRFIRDIVISRFMSRDGCEPYLLDKGLHQKLTELSQLLKRDPDCIAEECIMGILHQLIHPEGPEPLIIQEIRLRQKYHQNVSPSSEVQESKK